MTKKKYRRKYQKPFPIIPVALGLFLIGFALLAFVKPKPENVIADTGVVPFAVNYAAPELSLQNINGTTESLADYREHVVLVNNWATRRARSGYPRPHLWTVAHGAAGRSSRQNG